MAVYGTEECEPCKHGTRFPQGMFCFDLGRYISEDGVYSKSCGKFSVQQANAADGMGLGVNLDTKVCPTCGSTRLFGGIFASRR